MLWPRRTRGGALRIRGPKRLIAFLVALAVSFVVLGGAGAQSTGGPEEVGSWTPLLNWPVYGKHLSLMHTGEVLAFSLGSDVHVWNPTTNTFSQHPAPFGDLHCAGHSTLADGKVMVIGGVNVEPFVGTKVAATFDPVTRSWTQQTTMQYARWYPTATTLPDGRLLATSGTDAGKAKVTIPEIYDPASNTWSLLTGASRTQELYPFTYVLPNGKVFNVGRDQKTWYLDTSGAGSWTPGPTPQWSNVSGGCCSEAGTMYGIGKIMRSGGGDPAHARTAVIDMTAATPAWQETAPMAFPRRRHNIVIMADGNLLAVGGTKVGDDPAQAVLPSEIWDRDTKAWRTVAGLSLPRMYHSASLLLPDGRVVASGGDYPNTAKLSAQIYSPPYLFAGDRPRVTSGPGAASYGGSFMVGTDTAGVTSVALIRPGSVTHAIDMNERYVPLTFSQAGSELTVDAPANANIAPPGYYMLVIENGAGVPSVAHWVNLGGSGGPSPPPDTPVANFTASPTTGAAPLKVSFTDTSTGFPTQWEWDFQNDGTIDSIAQNPEFEYTAAGTYTVRLRVRNAALAPDDEVKTNLVTVTAGGPPPPATEPVTFAAEADARVQEANPSTNYGTSYLRADGSTDPDVESYLRFTVSGIPQAASATLRVYATTFTANGPAVYTAGSSWSESGITWGNRPARSASGTADKGSIAPNSWVEFDVSPLVSGDGTYTFVLATDSTDGLQLNSREATTTTLRPQLVVTPAVEPPTPPLADFRASATRGTAPMTVQFTNLSTGSTPMTQEWDFQNDLTIESTQKNASFTYTEPGVYSVRLRVENDLGGDEEIKTDYITVEAPTPGETLAFTAVADAYVQSNIPTTNRGTGSNLSIDGSPISRAWIRFDVQGLSGPVTQATLRVLGATGSSVGFAVHGAGDASWGETTINYSNAPPFSASVVGSSAAYAAAQWVEIDVTDLVSGNGPVSFVLTTSTSTAMSVRARETSTDPQLVVKTGLAAPKTAQTHLHSH